MTYPDLNEIDDKLNQYMTLQEELGDVLAYIEDRADDLGGDWFYQNGEFCIYYWEHGGAEGYPRQERISLAASLDAEAPVRK